MAARHTSALEALLVDEAFDGDVYPHEPMNRHTTYRIGGSARFFVQVNSVRALRRLVQACEESSVDWVVMGRGSNVLVSDEGYDGVVMSLGRDFRNCRFDEESMRFYAGAGVALSSVVQDAFHRSLAGLEFAVGTPGTLGGALYMNAGSRDEWIGNCVESVTTFSREGGLVRRAGSEIIWEYRSSSFGPDEVILECELVMKQADPFFIRGKMEAFLAKRKKTQPLRDPSCGSVFKNPEGKSAGELIEKVGLKGKEVGGAQISEVHANFIVNKNNASAQDVRALIECAQNEVFEAYGIELSPEVKFLGF